MRLMIVGATSAIAAETARRFAADGAALFLAGRNAERLAAIAEETRTSGAERVETYRLDLTDPDQHPALLAAADAAFGGLDAVLIAHGTLPDQRACEASVADTMAALDVNLLSTVSFLTLVANAFERQRHGCIAVITSVAGDRGRQSNYVYGAAKGALGIFLEGLRNRLHPAGVSVVTIKPGMVRTPMTAHLPQTRLMADPADVAASIHRAIRRGTRVVYTPWFWRPIMAGIRSIPDAVFERLRL